MVFERGGYVLHLLLLDELADIGGVLLYQPINLKAIAILL
jgi:hypothetical protein